MTPNVGALGIIVALTVYGCSGGGPGLNGVEDHSTAIKGTIDRQFYVSPNGEFRIKIPHAEEASEFHRMAITEHVSDEAGIGTTVSFGPSRSDPNIYRLRIVDRQEKPDQQATFLDDAKQVRHKIIQEAEVTYDAILSKYHAEKLTLNGYEALFSAYRQPIQSVFTLRGTASTRIRYHAIYFVNCDDKVVLFWVEVPDRPWGVANVGDQIQRHEEPSVNRFVSSFEWISASLPPSPPAPVP